MPSFVPFEFDAYAAYAQILCKSALGEECTQPLLEKYREIYKNAEKHKVYSELNVGKCSDDACTQQQAWCDDIDECGNAHHYAQKKLQRIMTCIGRDLCAQGFEASRDFNLFGDQLLSLTPELTLPIIKNSFEKHGLSGRVKETIYSPEERKKLVRKDHRSCQSLSEPFSDFVDYVPFSFGSS